MTVIGRAWITPEVNGAGSAFAGVGGTAAVASAIAETTFDVAVGARPGEAAVGSCAAICAGLDGASASATSALASAALRSLIAAALRVLERSEERRVGKECRSRWS